MIEHSELASLDQAFEQALNTCDDSDLNILGYGELSVVVGWPTDRPEYACKRLPVFESQESFDRYRAAFDRYLAVLCERGIRPVDSELRTVEGDGESVVGYCVQPILAARTLGPEVLRRESPDADHPVLGGITEAIVKTVDEHIGLDAQLSNWAWADGELSYLDLTTPMVRSHGETWDFDVDIYLTASPWLLRGAIRRWVLPSTFRRYHNPRPILRDLCGNLIKEKLEPWVPAAIEACNRHLDGPITPEEGRKGYASAARLGGVMLRVPRAARHTRIAGPAGPSPLLIPRLRLSRTIQPRAARMSMALV